MFILLIIAFLVALVSIEKRDEAVMFEFVRMSRSLLDTSSYVLAAGAAALFLLPSLSFPYWESTSTFLKPLHQLHTGRYVNSRIKVYMGRQWWFDHQPSTSVGRYYSHLDLHKRFPAQIYCGRRMVKITAKSGRKLVMLNPDGP